MNLFSQLIDFILHVDVYLSLIIQNFGIFTYIILFLIILCETGLVVTPFLPGDSLLFVTGAFAAKGDLNIFVLTILLIIAAILGDSLNYFIGNRFSEILMKKKLVNKEYLQRTQEFYKIHGGKAIFLARFVPIIRTFAPFVAGIGQMRYSRFIGYNVLGGIVWVLLFLLAGFFFGNIPVVQENLTLVILAIVVISFIPPVLEYLKHKRRK
jgi:membrane-associated protein